MSENTGQNDKSLNLQVTGQLEEMERMIRELQVCQRNIRRRSWIITAMLIVVILGFAEITYMKVKQNISQEKLQQAMSVQAEQILPQLRPQLELMAGELVPYYTELARERFASLSPKFEARVHAEADRLGNELEGQVNAQVEASFGRIANATLVKLNTDFPALAGAGGEKAAERLKQTMMQETVDLTEHTHKLYEQQANRIRQSLEKFPVGDVSNAEPEALRRQLLHHLLRLADYELTREGQWPFEPVKNTAGQK